MDICSQFSASNKQIPLAQKIEFISIFFCLVEIRSPDYASILQTVLVSLMRKLSTLIVPVKQTGL